MPGILMDQLPRLLAELEEVYKQIETGASMTEHGELRERLGVI
jgi:hypothetical protein